MHIGYDEIFVGFGHLTTDTLPKGYCCVIGWDSCESLEVKGAGIKVREIKTNPVVVCNFFLKKFTDVC